MESKTVTIAFFFFSSLSLFERKKKMKTKQNKKTKPGKRNEKKNHRVGPFSTQVATNFL